MYIKQRASTMNRDQGYHLPTIYNQIILLKSPPKHLTPVRDGLKCCTHQQMFARK